MVNLHISDFHNFEMLVNHAEANDGQLKLQINAGIWKIGYSEIFGDAEDSFEVTGNSLCEILADAVQNLPKSEDVLNRLRRKLGGATEHKLGQEIDPAVLDAQVSLYMTPSQLPAVTNNNIGNIGTDMHRAMERYVDEIVLPPNGD